MNKNKINILENILFNNIEAGSFINKNDFGSAARILLEHQKKDWKQLASGYNSLDTVQTKIFQFDGYNIKVQFNPGRIISSSARVDEKSIRERKCFLCFENLPAEQKGILYAGEYLILCNPFPIFPEHFTLPEINHTPQIILGSFGKLLSLGKDLSKYYTVFYNGPKCGASAPDHLHFQAGNKFFMPIDSEFNSSKNKYGKILFNENGHTVTGVDDGLRRFISFEGKDYTMLVHLFNGFYEVYNSLNKSEDEPMMNILSFYENETGWRVIIFLRDKHRPSHYFAAGEDNILLSPAAVDIGGVCITPLEKDFKKITKEMITAIFQEVAVEREEFEFIKSGLMKKLNANM